ncbi:hypothetical protein [Arhodomonas sp. AD133]|uniref:hypothetical protein n=1 Tax=Arhodomonas sp. AD133 TaxID=3415009 RepID=UPI003EBAB443
MTAYLPAFEATDTIVEALESGTLRVQTGQWVYRFDEQWRREMGRVKQFRHGAMIVWRPITNGKRERWADYCARFRRECCRPWRPFACRPRQTNWVTGAGLATDYGLRWPYESVHAQGRRIRPKGVKAPRPVCAKPSAPKPRPRKHPGNVTYWASNGMTGPQRPAPRPFQDRNTWRLIVRQQHGRFVTYFQQCPHFTPQRYGSGETYDEAVAAIRRKMPADVTLTEASHV